MFLFCTGKDRNNRDTFMLKVYEGPLNGQTIFLTQSSITIGRQEDNIIKINDPRISRHHARIDITGNTVYLTDLKSTAGTYINSKKIIRELLKEDIHLVLS